MTRIDAEGIGLLTGEQVFGEQAIKLIQKTGSRCPVTDYAVLTGAKPSPEEEKTGKREERDRFSDWFLSSAAGGGDVCAVKADGQRAVAYASSLGNIRPVLSCRGDQSPAGESKKDISGFQELRLGEYPQDAADRDLARRLESEYAAGLLRHTGKKYDGTLDEFVFRGEKFVRMEVSLSGGASLSGGRKCREGEGVWIRVSPVAWLFDEEAGLLLSRRILLGGVRFDGSPVYDGIFENTEICGILRGRLAKELSPSELREMTAEEEAEHERERRKAAERRNPYGLKFGQVTEEDIIRGAIESDVAVFLHGPSSEGKSARVKQIDPTCEIVYLRNATPDSLNGRSVYNQETGEMIDIPPTWYKKVKAKCEAEPDRFHVVFFDEINNALPSIQGMAFNIVLDREVNGLWKLPDNARVVAAGNDMQDSLAANQIAAPFFNRFAHVYINTTTEKWLKWARENSIHPAIYAYIAYRNGETLRSEYDGKKPNADPRKWEMASKMLYATGRPEMLRALIGEEITDDFVQFCSQPVITLERVMTGDYKEREIEEMNTARRYATTLGLSQADETQEEKVRAFVRRLGEEFLAVFDGVRAGR